MISKIFRMVINRASYQRGFAHGTVIKVERINLAENATAGKFGRKSICDEVFLGEANNVRPASIGPDGLPIQGRMYTQDEFYCRSVSHNDYKNGLFLAHST